MLRDIFFSGAWSHMDEHHILACRFFSGLNGHVTSLPFAGTYFSDTSMISRRVPGLQLPGEIKQWHLKTPL